MSDLLPCPFCGSDAETFVNSRGYRIASCTDCEAEADLDIWDARVCSCHGDYHIVDDNKKVDHIPDASSMMTHEQIYWMLHEEGYAFCCMSGSTPEQASRSGHIYAIQNTHQVFLEQSIPGGWS